MEEESLATKSGFFRKLSRLFICQLLIINDSNLHGVGDDSKLHKFAFSQRLSKISRESHFERSRCTVKTFPLSNCFKIPLEIFV